MEYCETIFQTVRWKTREVRVGSLSVGGDAPIRIQSMTTSDTRDAPKTIDQIIRLADAGCEIVRVTVQGKKEAESCEAIKNGLLVKGYTIPIVADIHFYPPAAMHVAQFVDKVRINPGNFVDRRASFKVIEYTESLYALELEKIEEGFSPLVQLCKRLKKAIRIGANHGSLSDRIMNRYGDTPRGMVESALEYARVCRKHDFHDLIFSMKSSNPALMIQAYRLLAAEMRKLGWNYPLHLGVTEAGEGEDGRLKSSIGIGALLLDGLGDTIRVSLTEDPWAEIDPCKRLVRWADQMRNRGIDPFEERGRSIEEISPRKVFFSDNSPLHRNGSVILKVNPNECTIDTPDSPPVHIPVSKVPLSSPYALLSHGEEIPPGRKPEFILFQPTHSPVHETRRFIDRLKMEGNEIPVILAFTYNCEAEDLPIHVGAEMGACLTDRLAEGVCILSNLPSEALCRLSYNLLQAARMRMIKTDFISCPSCGRTLFDLQEVSRRIREKTAHLPGVKIAIMGCIVNGPGEMADADFGYVGSRPDKIDLYVGKTCVEKNIDFSEADERLIELIKAHDKWVEPDLTSREIYEPQV